VRHKDHGKSVSVFGTWADEKLVQAHSLTIGSWNTWSGCLSDTCSDPEAVIKFAVEVTRRCDIIGLYEVHKLRRAHTERYVQPRSAKGRVGRIDLEFLERVAAAVSDTHKLEFVAHFNQTALHDCEATDLPIDYGNAILVRKHLYKRPHKVVVDRFLVFGIGNLNTEDSVTLRGRPASRQGFLVTVQTGNQSVTVAFVHGLWTRRGKVDMPARLAQSTYIAQAIHHHRTRQNLNSDEMQTIVIGDLNYTSNLTAFQALLENKSAFGEGGGTNLIPDMDTRTKWYPEDKPTRQANFIVTSGASRVRILSQRIEQGDEVLSDHAYLELVYNNSPGTH
jgi:hypothetical protein